MAQARIHIAFCTLVLSAILSVPLSAQSVGVAENVGLTVATMVGEGARETSPRLGVAVGGFLVLTPHRSFSVQLGLVYSTKGTGMGPQVFTDSSPAFTFRHKTVERTLTLRALEVQALLSVALPPRGLRFDVGPAASLNLSCDLYSSFIIDRYRRSEWQEWRVAGSTECSDAMETVDWSLVIGGGVDFWLGGRWLTIDARYAHGLSVAYRGQCTGFERELDGAPGCVEDTGFDGKNRVLTLSVGVGFGW